MESGKTVELTQKEGKNGERRFFEATQNTGFIICYEDGTEEHVRLDWIGRYTMVVFSATDQDQVSPQLVYKHAIKKIKMP